ENNQIVVVNQNEKIFEILLELFKSVNKKENSFCTLELLKHITYILNHFSNQYMESLYKMFPFQILCKHFIQVSPLMQQLILDCFKTYMKLYHQRKVKFKLDLLYRDIKEYCMLLL